jgi:hypothetical protein
MSKPIEPKMSPEARRLLTTVIGLMQIQKTDTCTVRDVRLAHNARLLPREIPAAISELRAANLIDITQGRRGCTFTLKPITT